MWRVLTTHSILQFPLHFPFRASPCAITFQTQSTFDEVYKASGSQDHDHPHTTFKNNYQHFCPVNLQYGVVVLLTSSLDCTPASNGWQAVFTPNICERNASLLTEISCTKTMLDMATTSVKKHPHFSQVVRQNQNQQFTNHFVCKWPQWSPNMNPLNYRLWVTGCTHTRWRRENFLSQLSAKQEACIMQPCFVSWHFPVSRGSEKLSNRMEATLNNCVSCELRQLYMYKCIYIFTSRHNNFQW